MRTFPSGLLVTWSAPRYGAEVSAPCPSC